MDGGPVNVGQTKTTGAPPTPAGKTLFLTDLVLENPQGDTGTITVRRGAGAGGVLFQIGLGNFRDLDYHFVAPLMFRPGGASDLEIDVACTTPGGTPPAPSCDPAAVVSGVYGQLP